jgi:hypothetical protein
MTHSPSNARETHTAGAMMIAKDAASALEGLARRCLVALCVAPSS